MLLGPSMRSVRDRPSLSVVLGECDYDHIAALGQRLLGASACAVSLSKGRTWIAVREDMTPTEAQNIFEWTLPLDSPASLSDRYTAGRLHIAQNPHEPCIAAVPIRLTDGQTVGTLQAIDFGARTFVEQDLGWLGRLGECVAREVDLRLACAVDALTGVWSRPAFLDALDYAIETEAVALAIMDLDSFKAINDTFGHATGDTVLAGIGRLMRRQMADVPADMGRLGGEEFGLLFTDMSMGEVFGALHALRQALSCEAFDGLGGIRVTASIGVTQIRPGAERSELLYKADEALYHAKYMGKNRVEDAASLSERRQRLSVAGQLGDAPTRRVRAV